MKKINRYNNALVSLFIATAGFMGCNEEVTKLEFDKDYPTLPEVIPPGDEYVKDGEKCMNVFYLIPQELDTIFDWHRRLSGITLNMQEYIRENYVHAGLGDKTFNLYKNKASKDFIKIHLLRSKKVSIYSENIQLKEIKEEIQAYWKENPGTQLGNNTLVYLPKYAGNAPFHGSYAKSSPDAPAYDLGFGVVTVDHEDFDINYAGTLAGKVFLSSMPAIIHELGHACWIPHNRAPWSEVQYSLMSVADNYYFDSPRTMRFTQADLLWMQELDIFKPNRDTEDFSQAYKVRMVDNKIIYEDGILKIDYQFTADKKPALLIAYGDPWLSNIDGEDEAQMKYTEYDAVSYVTNEITESNGIYRAQLNINWEDYLSTENNRKAKKGEIRYRIVFEGGHSFPSVYELKGQGPTSDESLKPSVVRFFYSLKDGIPVFE